MQCTQQICSQNDRIRNYIDLEYKNFDPFASHCPTSSPSTLRFLVSCPKNNSLILEFYRTQVSKNQNYLGLLGRRYPKQPYKKF